MTPALRPSRPLFVATILAGSFLLFLVQPMVARMALPRLGGAPNVWNSAMLVYQALLLGGYAYAHWLGKLALRRQAQIHLGLLAAAAALTLPIGLVNLPSPAAGWEALWVPALLGLSVGPVFFLVSAQAPLMQRWYAADPRAGEPWALYAASNLGSFGGLLAYPLLAEPLLGIAAQGWAWSAGYGALFLLVALAARARRGAPQVLAGDGEAAGHQPIPARRILLWLALSAVPSGLMLSTTTHLTTDLFAMPLLWVIPLGLYLLSFVFAFSDTRHVARWITLATPSMLLLVGGMAMASRHLPSMIPALAACLLLFIVCVALHARLYDLRPHSGQLTLFYFVMSAGGALGGVFTALVAPLVFDWVWEHPILVFIAALLMPRLPELDWRRLKGLEPDMAKLGVFALLATIAVLAWLLWQEAGQPEPGTMRLVLMLAICALGVPLVPWRTLFALVLGLLMLVQGGLETIETTLRHERTRSYFGVYTVRDYPDAGLRTLAHGTTLHGEQSTDPKFRLAPISYYGPDSGVGIVLSRAQALFGPGARIGVVGLGTGTLACYRRPGEHWRFFEIDPAVLAYSRNRTFTYLADCAPNAAVVLGDARLKLAELPRGSLDVLAVDAFSSDAIPLHLLTEEAFGVYLDALSERGLLLVHISNRYIELEPVLAAIARKRGLAVAVRDDAPQTQVIYTPSSWVLFSRDPARIEALRKAAPETPLTALKPPAARAWTDDHASILPYVRWRNILRSH